jgi:tetratricopeptide (TPR) repeat protein
VIRTLLFLTVVLPSFSSLAQREAEKEKIKEIETQKQIDRQRKITMAIDSAVRLSEEGEYEAADEKFKRALKVIRSVPTDLTYHFGRNSFFLGKYRQSVDWLNKYIQLKGTTGQYSNDAVEWLKKAEVELLKEKEEEAKQAQLVLSSDYTIDCGPSGKVVCPVCKGTTVVTKKDYFGTKYSTCGYCKTKGHLDCEDYNKLLKGQLKPTVN